MAGGNIPSQLVPVFQAASARYGIPANVLAGVASVESNFNPNAISPVGARGITQFMPGTAQQEGVNVRDPVSEIMGTAKYLTELGFHQNPTRALASYNAGPGNYTAGLGYAKQVLSEAQRFGGATNGSRPQQNTSTVNLPALTSGSLPALSVDVPTFDQAGYDKAQKGYILGQFLRSQRNPFDTGKEPDTGPSALGALFEKGVLSTRPPNRADYQGSRTVQIAHNSLVQLAGTQLQVHPGAVPGYKGYVNPLPGFSIGRTDMGVDANARPGTPIRAIGDSKVVAIRPNWYQGQPYLQMQLLNGPRAGQYYYVAEQINPTVQPGQVVHAGDPIATYANQGTGIEIGWGTKGWQTLAQAQGNTGDAAHGNAPAGVDFKNFLGSLGG